jgi:hypothetical protein
MNPLFKRAVAGRRVGTMIAAGAIVALVVAGGTAAGLSISSNGSTPAPSSPATTAKSAATPMTVAPTVAPTTVPPTAPVQPSAAGPTAPPPTTGASPSGTTPLVAELITDTCVYSHEANNDPILMPGQAGQSMAHDFFGNTTTSATSTASTLVGGPSTCSTSADASAYWTPVLYQNGVAITPERNLIYWAGLHATDPAVTAPPVGLEMIAGNENATAPQSVRVVAWRCADQQTQVASATPVNCPGTRGLELRVTFPSCWNGTTLNGASETNVVYPEADTRCPAGYPVRIPTVIFHVVYPVTSAAGLTLSMGPGQQGTTDTAHGDFINGWNQSVLARLIGGCASPALTCGHATGANAQVHRRVA